MIFSLCFSASLWDFMVRSCTFSVTSSASSSVIVYYGTPLCTLIFLHATPIYTIILFGGLGCVGSIVLGVSGIFPLACPSCAGMFSFLWFAPLEVSAQSLCYVNELGIIFFFVVVLPLVFFFFYATFLVLPFGVLFICDEPASIGCFSFVGCLSFGISTRTFHSSCQYFISHWNSSVVMQYLICNHSFFGSLLAWIHILCFDALKFSIVLCSSTTFGGILQVSSTFSWISSRYAMKILEFVCLYFETVVCQNDSYYVVRHLPFL
jgi:hypothetical protein